MKLYIIQTELERLLEEAHQEAIDNNGEISEELASKIDALYGSKDEKIVSCIRYYKNLLAEAKMIKFEEDLLKKRRISLENKASRHKDYMSGWLSGEKFKKGSDSISWKPGEAVHVPEITITDKNKEKFKLWMELQPKWDKKLLKKELSGEVFSGWLKSQGFRINKTNNIQIK